MTSTGLEGQSVSGLAREMGGGGPQRVHHSQNLVAEQERLIGSRGYREEAWVSVDPEGVPSALEAAWVQRSLSAEVYAG